MNKWFLTSGLLAAGLVGMVVWSYQQRITINHYDYLLNLQAKELYGGASLISTNAWEITKTVDLQQWERMFPGYLIFFHQLESHFKNIQEILDQLEDEVFKSNKKINLSTYFNTYQKGKEKIIQEFFLFGQANSKTLGRNTEEMEAWLKYISSLFMTDSLMLAFEDLPETFQLTTIALIQHQLAILNYELTLQITALGCQRNLLSEYSPLAHIPSGVVNQNDSVNIDIQLVQFFDNLNAVANHFLANGDTLKIMNHGIAEYQLPTNEVGSHQLKIEFFGIDPIRGIPLETSSYYTYQVTAPP